MSANMVSNYKILQRLECVEELVIIQNINSIQLELKWF
jgi:hypothetical protein